MKRYWRTLTYTVFFLVLLALGGVFYLFQRLSPIIERQTATYLAAHGVSDISLGEPSLGFTTLRYPEVKLSVGGVQILGGSIVFEWTAKQLLSAARWYFLNRDGRAMPVLPIESVQLGDLTAQYSGLRFIVDGTLTDAENGFLYLGSLDTPWARAPQIEAGLSAGNATVKSLEPLRIKVKSDELLGSLFFAAEQRDRSLAFSVALDLPELHGSIAGKGAHNFSNGLGELILKGSEFQVERLLSQLGEIFGSVATELSLKEGSIVPEGEIRWGEALDQRYSFDVRSVSGRLKEVEFEGADGKVDLLARERGFTIRPSLLRVRSVQSGVVISEIKSELGGEFSFDGWYEVNVGPTTAQAFEGPVRASKVTLTPKKSGSRFTVLFPRAPLSALLGIIPNSPVEGSGEVEITLPIKMAPEGVSVSKGTLRALPPGGMLFYKDSGAGDQFAGTQYEFVIAALKNYNYTKLEADISLATNGELVIAASLSGVNPDVNRTRPIDVNVNIEQNLFKLLESIRAVQRFGAR